MMIKENKFLKNVVVIFFYVFVMEYNFFCWFDFDLKIDLVGYGLVKISKGWISFSV